MLLLKFLLWMVAAMHLVVGGGLMIAPGFAHFMVQVYGAQVDWTPEFAYILRPLGAFMFVLGLLAAAAGRHPGRHRFITHSLAVLFALRALQRLLLAEQVQEAFGISASRNAANMLFFTFLAGALAVVDLWANRQVRSTNRQTSDVPPG